MSLRLYAQLEPDADSLHHIHDVQQRVPGRGRRVSLERIHLTLIHFGIVDPIIESMPCDQPTAQAALKRYIAESEIILNQYPNPFEFQPTGFELFGEYGQTLVIRYASTSSAEALHRQLLTVLKQFLSDCGISDVNTFMQADANFKHALTLTPHVTISKGYTGKLPLSDMLQPIKMNRMPFVYS